MIHLQQQYVDNITAGLIRDLIESLGGKITISAIRRLGVGFDFSRSVYTFPERDGTGRIVGFQYRTLGGRKFQRENTHRGLTYECRGLAIALGERSWVPCTKDRPCPICGRTKYCAVSAVNPDDPPAVMCTKVAEGAVPWYHHEINHLHVLKPEENVVKDILPASRYPILVVEGASDVLAAMSIGLVAVGRPSSHGGQKDLSTLLAGRPILIVAENDSGAGKDGAGLIHAALKKVSTDVRLTSPPAEYKDLREWITRGDLTADTLFPAALETPATEKERIILNLEDPFDSGRKWIEEEWSHDGTPTLRYHMQRWVAWNGQRYAPISDEEVRGQLYRWLDGTIVVKATKSTVEPKKFPSSKMRVNNILDSLNAICPVAGDAPKWLDDTALDPRSLVAFTNGILDINTWKLYELSPKFFSYNSLPFEYNPDVDVSWWEELVDDILMGDREKARLLQQWFGYCMTADTSQEKLMIFVGQPRSGKGTILTGLETLFGDDQICATSFESLCSPFGFEPLLGKLVATLGDATMPRGYGLSSALEKLLNITGEDGVQVNRKYKTAKERVRLTVRFTIALNLLPSLRDHANALAPRLNIIEFTNSYQGRENRQLKQMIRRRGQMICTWALRGLADLRKHGCFVDPKANDHIKKRFERLSTPMIAFLHECCNVQSGESVAHMDLWAAYNAWAQENGLDRASSEVFKQRLIMVEPSIQEDAVRRFDTVVAGWSGVSLSRDAMTRYLGTM